MKLISGRYRVMNYNTVFLISLFLLVRCDMKKSIPIKEGFIKIKDVELYYMILGKGEPVVILHGGPGFDHDHMLPMSEFAKDYKVIFYDQRATGNSS